VKSNTSPHTEVGPDVPGATKGTPCASVEPPPEWITIEKATRLFSISRSRLYELLSDPRVKSCSLKKRGNLRGRRLIFSDSIRDLLNSLAAVQSDDVSTH
jgi:hypothetical protein